MVYFFSFSFRKNKKNAIAKLKELIKENCKNKDWYSPLFKATQLIESLRSTFGVDEVDSVIKDEVRWIMYETKSTIQYFNPDTNWYNWGDVKLAINHSGLAGTRKDELEKLAIVLSTITGEFDLSHKSALR